MHADVFHEYRMVKMLRLMDDIGNEGNKTTRRVIRGINELSIKQRIEKVFHLLLKIERLRVKLAFRFRRLLGPQPALKLSYQGAYHSY